jgi:hypothetical protein
MAGCCGAGLVHMAGCCGAGLVHMAGCCGAGLKRRGTLAADAASKRA